jgi:hypothetical protein
MITACDRGSGGLGRRVLEDSADLETRMGLLPQHWPSAPSTGGRAVATGTPGLDNVDPLDGLKAHLDSDPGMCRIFLTIVSKLTCSRFAVRIYV